MPFDYLLGVGRSPQITKDFVINPYSIINTDASSLFKIDNIFNRSDSWGIAETGNQKDFINPDFDSSINTAYTLEITGNSSTTSTVLEIIFDLEKEVYIKNIEYKFEWARQLNVGTAPTNRIWEMLIRGTNEEVLLSKSGVTQDTYNVNQGIFRYKKARQIVFRYRLANGGVLWEKFGIKFYNLRVMIDNFQY